MADGRHCFEEVPPGQLERVPAHGSLAIEIHGTLGIERAMGDQIEARIAGRIRAHQENGAARPAGADFAPLRLSQASGPHEDGTRVDARRRSSGALAASGPFVWLQFLDGFASPLTGEIFLGRGVGVAYPVHTRVDVWTLAQAAGPLGPGAGLRAPPGLAPPARLASAIHARVLTRTYRRPMDNGVRMEVLLLTLLGPGARIRVPLRPPVPVTAPAPAWPAGAGGTVVR